MVMRSNLQTNLVSLNEILAVLIIRKFFLELTIDKFNDIFYNFIKWRVRVHVVKSFYWAATGRTLSIIVGYLVGIIFYIPDIFVFVFVLLNTFEDTHFQG
jgi:hypothetical protein